MARIDWDTFNHLKAEKEYAYDQIEQLKKNIRILSSLIDQKYEILSTMKGRNIQLGRDALYQEIQGLKAEREAEGEAITQKRAEIEGIKAAMDSLFN